MSFQELHLSAALLRNLDRLGHRTPTAIQAQAIPSILDGRDVLGIARTGTGKTAAFALPLAELLIRMRHRRSPAQRSRSGGARASARRRGGRPEVGVAPGPRALILCPTRELAVQVAEEIESLASGSALAVGVVHGKVALSPQVQALAEGIDLLVATPGRCIELLSSGALALDGVRHVVLDEADRMLDMGFAQQLGEILAAVPRDRQSLLFSATMPEEVESLAEAHLRHPVRLEVDRRGTPVAHVRQRAMLVADREKVPVLLRLLGAEDGDAGSGTEPRATVRTPPARPLGAAPSAPVSAGRRGSDRATVAGGSGAIVFCRTRRRAHWIGTALVRHGLRVGYLHGDRSHAQRERALRSFARGDLPILVATDVAARGLHVAAVATVINYDVALSPAEHIHRIGRAAHGLEGRGGAGDAISFVSPEDRARWAAVVEASGTAVEIVPTPAIDEPPRPEPAEPRTSRTRGGRPARAEPIASTAASPRAGRRGKESALERAARPGGGVERRSAGPSGRGTASARSAGRSADGVGAGAPRRDAASAPPPRVRSGRGKHSGDPAPWARPKRSRPIGKSQKPGGGVRPPRSA
ncbi:MAG TPA: DEAD/DEAH box helicase [Phycisphaerales bacterium]|nr:DEAD/DEAH box helicase [Phycisphaerales bacterium]HMP37524.1 DEAD/DEAH box helicase [Phycisphaerales bacterium]